MDELNGEHVAVLEQSKHDERGAGKIVMLRGLRCLVSLRALSVYHAFTGGHGLIPITGDGRSDKKAGAQDDTEVDDDDDAGDGMTPLVIDMIGDPSMMT